MLRYMSQQPSAWASPVVFRGPLVRVADNLVMPAVVEVLVALEGELEPRLNVEDWRPGPHARVTVEVDEDGRPGVRQIVVTDMHPAGMGEHFGEPTRPITEAALRNLSIDACIRAAVEVCARDAQGGYEDRPEDQVEATITRARRRRTELTPVRLQAVAFAYRQGRDKGGDHAAGVRAVREQMHVSREHSYRLVARAIGAGFIQPTKEDQ
jgi:hypothetical protein